MWDVRLFGRVEDVPALPESSKGATSPISNLQGSFRTNNTMDTRYLRSVAKSTNQNVRIFFRVWTTHRFLPFLLMDMGIYNPKMITDDKLWRYILDGEELKLGGLRITIILE